MDKSIKRAFEHKNYTRLEYLADENIWTEDPNNIGLYFFLLELKGEDTTQVFNKILDDKKNKISSYKYLADIANKLFSGNYRVQVASYYYKKVLKFDDANAQALWKLYELTSDDNYFLNAIKADYKAKDFKNISCRITGVFIYGLAWAEFDKADWKILKEICLDENVTNHHYLLMICYCHLEDFDCGLSLMEKKDSIDNQTIDLYLAKGCIDLNYALKKLSLFDRIKYLKNDTKGIYEEVKKEVGNGNVTKELLIESAFKANEYKDVISLVEGFINKSSPSNTYIEQRLYHIISSICLGNDTSAGYEMDVNLNKLLTKNELRDKCFPLYISYLVLSNIKNLEAALNEEYIFYDIEFAYLYQEIKDCLNHEEILNHY